MTSNGRGGSLDECEKLIEKFPIGVYYLDFKTLKFRDPNNVVLKYTGYSKEEFESIKPSILLTEESYERFLKRMQKVANKESVPENEEFEIVTKNGERYWVLLSSQWRYEGEYPIEAFCVVTNITPQKMLEKQLQEALKKSQLYLDIAYNIFLALDTNGNIVLINKAGCNALGIDECFLVGQNWFDNYVQENERDYLKKIFNDSIRNGFGEDVISYENKIITSNGMTRLIRWRNTLLKDDKGNITGSFSSGEDITEQKQLEEQLLKLWKEGEKEFKQLLKEPRKHLSVGISPPIARAVFLMASGAK
jgi:PAS domain S-box-containing protein